MSMQSNRIKLSNVLFEIPLTSTLAKSNQQQAATQIGFRVESSCTPKEMP
jgi:hypothetical protein